MPKTLDQLVEQEAVKSGATRKSVRAVIELYAIKCEQSAQAASCSNQTKKEFRALAARAGRILYYSRHYAPAGLFTPADSRLCEIAENLPH